MEGRSGGLSLAEAATSTLFVAPKICHDKHVLVTTKRLLSRQAYFRRDKRRVLSLQNYISGAKYLSWQTFVATKVLSQQAYFCRDKRRVLSRQTRVCRSFVVTKITLVADPAIDSGLLSLGDAHSVWLRDLAVTGVNREHSRWCPAYVESEPALLSTTEVTRQQCSVSFGWQPTNYLTSPPVDFWVSYVYCVCVQECVYLNSLMFSDDLHN